MAWILTRPAWVNGTNARCPASSEDRAKVAGTSIGELLPPDILAWNSPKGVKAGADALAARPRNTVGECLGV